MCILTPNPLKSLLYISCATDACGTAAVQSSSHMTIGSVAELASELKLHRMAPAPLLLFACVDHIDRLQLENGLAEVEFRADAHGQS